MPLREHHDDLCIDLLADVEQGDPPAGIWFEVTLTMGGTGFLYLGADLGSRPVCPTLRLFVSNAFDPFGDFTRMMEAAYTGTLPYAFELDSEGPCMIVSMRPVAGQATALLEIRGYGEAIVMFAAEVDPRQTALAFAHALRLAIDNPELVPEWIEWFMYYGRREPIVHEYWDSRWLRDVEIAEHPSKGHYYYDGIDTVNGTRFGER